MEFPGRVEQAVVYPWKANGAAWEELKYSLRSVEKYFSDRDCPIYILGTREPEFIELGRVQYFHANSYEDALAIGVQLAERILWMNDDIVMMRDLGWEDFETHRYSSPMARKTRDEWARDTNAWKRGVARGMDDLEHQGKGDLYGELHLPYLWECEKALEIFRVYGCWWKMPMETLMLNHFALQAEVLGDWRCNDPLEGGGAVLNYCDRDVTAVFCSAMRQRFPEPAAWEKAAAVTG